jgi:Lrp/AsnC family leucine-responsive transcriptional regulator
MNNKQIIETQMELQGDLDAVGRRLLAVLQEDARLSYNALARRVGLSPPAVAERVRRMEEAGLIAGYRADVDPARAGLPVIAFLRLLCPGDRQQAVRRLAIDLPRVLECHHVTGEDCFIIKVAAPSIAALEDIVDRFREHGRTISSIALSTVVADKPIVPPGRPRE